MVAEARGAVEGARRIADLFCGLGAFTFPLAEVAPVLAIDGSAPAIRALGAAVATAPGLHGITAEARDLFRRPLSAVELKRIDAVVFDPPRAGALALGPENSTGLSTYLERTTEMNRSAYEAAVKDAAARAAATAKASGAKLGKLMVVQEGSGPCLGNWASMAGSDYDYYSAAPAYAPAPPPPPPPPPVASGMVDGRQVTITQADIDALNLPSDDRKQAVSSSVCMIYQVEQ
jgi:hypothetical protein